MEKTNNRSLKRSVLLLLLLQILVFTILYWGLIWFFDTNRNTRVLDALFNILGSRLYYSLFYNGRETLVVYAVILYVLATFLFCVRAILKVIQYIDRVNGAVRVLPERTADIPELPEELKDVEMTLKDIRHSLYRSEQLAHEAEQRKNDLVVYLAHDLKTPLTSVIGYLSLLQEAPELPAEQKAKYTETALSKAYRLEQLINEFFDITRFSLQSIELENNRINLSRMAPPDCR